MRPRPTVSRVHDMNRAFSRLIIVTFAAGLSITGAARTLSAEISFNRDIRPILSENCFACHGHDDQKRKANLRLDLGETATKPAKSGAIAIVPGKLDQSELVKRIT